MNVNIGGLLHDGRVELVVLGGEREEERRRVEKDVQNVRKQERGKLVQCHVLKTRDEKRAEFRRRDERHTRSRNERQREVRLDENGGGGKEGKEVVHFLDGDGLVIPAAQIHEEAHKGRHVGIQEDAREGGDRGQIHQLAVAAIGEGVALGKHREHIAQDGFALLAVECQRQEREESVPELEQVAARQESVVTVGVLHHNRLHVADLHLLEAQRALQQRSLPQERLAVGEENRVHDAVALTHPFAEEAFESCGVGGGLRKSAFEGGESREDDFGGPNLLQQRGHAGQHGAKEVALKPDERVDRQPRECARSALQEAEGVPQTVEALFCVQVDQRQLREEQKEIVGINSARFLPIEEGEESGEKRGRRLGFVESVHDGRDIGEEQEIGTLSDNAEETVQIDGLNAQFFRKGLQSNLRLRRSGESNNA